MPPRTGSPASSSWLTTPTSSSTAPRRRRRGATHTARSAGRTLGVSQSVRSPLRLWLVAARPRTLPAAIAPVLVGTALAGSEGVFKPLRFACARFVFLFFGVVAVVGSYFVQREQLEWQAFALSVPVGLLASAILVVNNVRDVDTDRRAGKRTLAVKLGRSGARRLFAAMLAV